MPVAKAIDNHMRKSVLALALTTIPSLSLLASSPAHAQSPGMSPDTTAVAAPASGDRTFATLDRVGNRTSLGAELALMDFKTLSFFGGETTFSASRLDLHGRYVHASGAGFGFELPVTFFSDDDGEDRETVVGNLSLDGLYRVQRGNTQIFLRAGVVLPTSDEDGELGLFSGLNRVTDFTTTVPETVALRFSVSPQYDVGPIFLRGDVGVDLLFDTDDGDLGEEDETHTLAHANVAVGYDTGPVDIAAEIANQHLFSENNGHLGEIFTGEEDGDTMTTVALSARYTEGPVEPHIALVLPAGGVLDTAVIIGIEGKLPL
jgi:hypothetical protein